MKRFHLIFLLFFLLPAHAAQVGIVTSKKAIIYADIERKSPIGFVKRGKKLAVGEVKRRQGKLLPVNVNGKLGWVETKNLRLPGEEKSFDKGRKVTEHVVEFEDKIKDPWNENNFLTVKSGPADFSSTFIFNDNIEEEVNFSDGQELSVMVEHRNPYLDFNWGLGLEYVSASMDTYAIRALSIKGGMLYVPLRLKIINLELYGNLVLSGDFRVESQGIGEYKGNMYGLDYGGLVRLFPNSTLNAHAGYGMGIYRLDGLDNIQNLANDDLLSVSSVAVTKLFVGVSYKF